ncbi:hypothetical protein ACFX15_030901 [Malus domestica]|uniref:ubiquitin-conjugating enzyme E2 4-like isoform X1 n=1 Tax=Malus sylvestris TaxID=3752 RepID=UPI0021AC289F|nr:ubiquitin-conjugating enzyme E2 4-like isoform X1 [Malus sylvestris]
MADWSFEDRKPKKHWMYEREGLRKVDFPSHCSYGPVNEDDPYKWQGMIKGPPDSPYEQGVFFLSIDLPPQYPNKPPTIKFLTKVYHPNINGEDGTIYVDILEEDKWNPVQNIESLLLSICSLLDDPNPVDPLNPSCLLFRKDKKKFVETAKEWTRKYAML